MKRSDALRWVKLSIERGLSENAIGILDSLIKQEEEHEKEEKRKEDNNGR